MVGIKLLYFLSFSQLQLVKNRIASAIPAELAVAGREDAIVESRLALSRDEANHKLRSLAAALAEQLRARGDEIVEVEVED